MLQIALLLFGAEFIRKKSFYFWIIGFLWVLLGIFIFIDGFDGQLLFPIHVFGFFLLFESLVTLSVASSGIGAQKTVLFFKGSLFLFCAIIAIIDNRYSNVLLSAMFGFVYFITGIFVVASAWVVRFPQWRFIFAWGILQMGFAFFLFTHNQATISFFLGFVMVGSGVKSLQIALRARHIQYGTSIFQLMHPVTRKLGKKYINVQSEIIVSKQSNDSHKQDGLTVHIWTPEGSASNRPIPRPVINRYIAAIDVNGIISTGHAALELFPDLYISLYPAEDIDHSPSEFFRLLKATSDNDVPGRFLSDYRAEAMDWCDSNRKIIFKAYNKDSLFKFWESHRQKPIYNLTYKNCSSTVAYALESALDGVLASRERQFFSFLRVLLMPELWIASQVRRRALTMAWTPGLVMDYARALHAIVQPVPIPWYKRGPWKRNRVKIRNK